MSRLSSLEIARIEEGRQARSTADVSIEAEPIAGGWMCYSEAGSWANLASGLGLAGPVTDADLDRLVAFYVDRGVEPRIEVCPFVDASLTVGLEARGFTLRQFETVLALDSSGDHCAGPPASADLEVAIETVDPRDPERVRAYIEVSTSGFRCLDEPIPDHLVEITRRMLEHDAVTGYLVHVAGAPAGAGALEVHGESCALFGTSVALAHRRRGIQQALIARRLARARELGVQLAVIQSRPGETTERNAARFGFAPAYTKATLARAL